MSATRRWAVSEGKGVELSVTENYSTVALVSRAFFSKAVDPSSKVGDPVKAGCRNIYTIIGIGEIRGKQKPVRAVNSTEELLSDL
jgi:hypothetical protein